MNLVSEDLIKAIAVTAELTGTELSLDAAKMMTSDLASYPEQQVLDALVKCRREIRSRLTLADVISRIDDGRPGAEAAWAMIPKNESDSVVWTREMAESFGVALPLIDDGDHIAARMAFIETYKVKCAESRNNGVPVKWEPSLGFDKNGREHVLIEAVEKGRLTREHVAGLLPYHKQTEFSEKLLSDKTNNFKLVGDIVKKIVNDKN